MVGLEDRAVGHSSTRRAPGMRELVDISLGEGALQPEEGSSCGRSRLHGKRATDH